MLSGAICGKYTVYPFIQPPSKKRGQDRLQQVFFDRTLDSPKREPTQPQMATTFCRVGLGDDQRKDERGHSCPPLLFAVALLFLKGEQACWRLAVRERWLC
jgi:hypothetical protein